MYDDMSYKEYLYLTGMSRWTQRLPEPGELLESPHPGFMESLLHGMQERQSDLLCFAGRHDHHGQGHRDRLSRQSV